MCLPELLRCVDAMLTESNNNDRTPINNMMKIMYEGLFQAISNEVMLDKVARSGVVSYHTFVGIFSNVMSVGRMKARWQR